MAVSLSHQYHVIHGQEYLNVLSIIIKNFTSSKQNTLVQIFILFSAN